MRIENFVIGSRLSSFSNYKLQHSIKVYR